MVKIMKKNCALIGILLAAVLLLAACGKAPTLSGRYSNSGFLAETVYEFDKDGTVSFKLVTGGYVAATLDGTYAINESGTEITLTFNEANTDFGSLLNSSTGISGTFSFSRGDGTIQIGNTQYTASK